MIRFRQIISAAVLGTGAMAAGATFKQAQVNHAAQICCAMETVLDTAAWITDSGSPELSTTGWGIGTVVVLRHRFDLTGFDLGTTELSATWRVADNLVGIFLNGVEVEGPIDGTWDADRSLQVTSGFNAGLNVLEVRATSVNSQWDGLWLAGTVRSDDGHTPVPLPGTLPLAVLALGLTVRRALTS